MTTAPDSKTFYNVMPEVTSGPISKPKTISPTHSSTTLQSQPAITQAFFTKTNGKKFVVLTIFGLILLGAIGASIYFFITQSNNKPADTSNVVSDTPTEVLTIADVTTPADWLLKYFGSETCTELAICGDKSDPDRDGFDNHAEFDAGTDPNNPDTDGDGLADGDEANIFSTDPLLSRTFRTGQYSDLDFVKGGYDISTNEPYTNEKLIEIKSKIKQLGLHQPTLSSLGPLSFQLYEFTDPTQPALPADLDMSPEAKLDRDSQRQSTIKKIGIALLKYKEDKKSFPPTNDFIVMADMIRSYNPVATNYNDPIDIQPYKYGYQALNNGTEFTLSYYSETQNQLIKYTQKNAENDSIKENTKVFDDQRKLDLERIREALLVWSTVQLDPASDKEFVFPTAEGLKTELVPRYMTALPTDPVTKQDYQYQVGPNFDTFTIRAALQNPEPGTTGYLCNQTECRNY